MMGPSSEQCLAEEKSQKIKILGFLAIVITSFKPSSDRHHHQLPFSMRKYEIPHASILTAKAEPGELAKRRVRVRDAHKHSEP
jgi:hypothetical protein